MIDEGEMAEFKNLDITTGTSGMTGAGFENSGTLILWDIWLYRNTLLPPSEIIIYNSGPAAQLLIKGIVHIEMD